MDLQRLAQCSRASMVAFFLSRSLIWRAEAVAAIKALKLFTVRIYSE